MFESFKKDSGIGISYHELAIYDFFLFNGHCLIVDHDVYPNTIGAKAEDFESLPLNIALIIVYQSPKSNLSKLLKPVNLLTLRRLVLVVGKHETLKFNFCSTFCGAKTEDKGKAVAIPDSSKKRKIIPYMPSNKSITIGSPTRTALASSYINIDQSPINLSDVALTTTTGDKKRC
ncbi:hypothetical protein NE237_009459 [Protea cynaroides]|uniref:Uncharacterized protein n=1 Tax=Protea cynaroides TaxID=273540 RepID=A0A9Q0KXZ4_9MAGN|nr:hypothetical protein NE237_009459 [Protea cynaroides]